MIDYMALDARIINETSRMVLHYFTIEKYEDPAGVLWVGQGTAPDEVWIVESGSDEGYMCKAEMQLKMTEEIVEAILARDAREGEEEGKRNA